MRTDGEALCGPFRIGVLHLVAGRATINRLDSHSESASKPVYFRGVLLASHLATNWRASSLTASGTSLMLAKGVGVYRL
jgi:hypothetical protein